MVRITDLLKLAKKSIREDKEKQPPSPAKEPSVFKNPPTKPLTVEKDKTSIEQPVKFARIFSQGPEESPLGKDDIASNLMRTPVSDEEGVKKIYFDAAGFIKKIFEMYKDNNTSIEEGEIRDMANKIVDNVILNSPELIRLVHQDGSEDYIYYHAVNVAIISVGIGSICKYSKSRLLDLAVIALLHDIDLIKSRHIIDKPAKLNEVEFKEITGHPLNAATFVGHKFSFTKEIINGILQHHERKDGKGYPAGLSDINIQDYAEIIGIADTYASMTHYRPYRKKVSPHIAILNIINTTKSLFSDSAIKALIAYVGLYPVDSWVELNSGEICKVVKINYNNPLRPVISILLDKNKNKLMEARTIDLREIPSLYIKYIVDEKYISDRKN